MLHTVCVRAITTFPHEGRTVHAGDALKVSPLSAVILARRRLIDLSHGFTMPVADRTAPDTEPLPERPRRRYRRRDRAAS